MIEPFLHPNYHIQLQLYRLGGKFRLQGYLQHMNTQLKDALNKIKIKTSGSATGKLNHLCDKSFVKEKFSELYEKGISLDSNIINQWALQDGWSEEDASELADLADDINEQ